MSDPKPEDLKKAEKLRDKAKFEEALELISNLENSRDLSPSSNLDCQILKEEILFWLGRYSEVLEICEKNLQESQRIGTNVQSFDVLIFQLNAFLYLGYFDEFREGIIVAEKIFNSITEELSEEYDRRKVFFNSMKGAVYNFKGELKKDLELQLENLRNYDKYNNKFVISNILYWISGIYLTINDLNLALEYCKKSLILREKLGNRSLISQNLLRMGFIYQNRGDLDQAQTNFEHSLSICKELNDMFPMSYSFFGLGWNYFRKMDMDKAKNYAEKCLLFQNTYIKRKRIWWHIFNLLGAIYGSTGELAASNEFYIQGLKLAEEEKNKNGMIILRTNLGINYRQQGDLNKSKEIFEEILAYWEGKGAAFYTLVNLFFVTYEMESFKEAQQFLDRIEKINHQETNKMRDQNCRLARAMMLKIDSGSRSRIKAEDILKKLLEEETWDPEIFEFSFLHLADLLLYEFKLNENLEILDELRVLISKAVGIAEQQRMYMLIAEVKLLQAKIALLTFDFEEARQFLSQSQRIADDHGLHLLARKISNEHDTLLNDVEPWEKQKREEVQLVERIKLSRISEQMGNMVQKRVNIPTILETEQSINIAVFSKTGYMAFSNRFTADSTFDEKIIGNFISMSGQMGTESLDRLRFGDYTVLLNIMDSFSICYVFRGQSYSAGQKLNNFTEAVKENKTIIEVLNTAIRTGQQIQLSDNLDLEELITSSFMADPTKFQLPFKAYKGDEPFIFVSYAHSDKLQVYPIMDYLNKSGFNVWYDEGISVSEDWKKSIVKNIENCSAFLVFITPHIIDSEYVRKEISYALSQKKPFFSVYLKDTKLPGELVFDISGIQSMKKYTMPDSEFYDKIKEVLSPVLSGKK